jgi:fibronectin type 3 domain-containing protein
MYTNERKYKHALFFLQFLIWTIMSLAGCGGSKNIPPASILNRGEVTLTWEEVTGENTYNVYFSKTPSVTVFNSYRISDATSPMTITDMEFNTTYYFIITVEDDSGQIRKSREMSYKVVSAEGSIQFGDILSHSEPSAAISDPKPTNKVSTPETQDVTLGWEDVPNATSYNIYWSDKPGVTKKNGTKISNVKNPHKIKGLKKGGKYYFVVTAVNASGESKESEEISLLVGQ